MSRSVTPITNLTKVQTTALTSVIPIGESNDTTAKGITKENLLSSDFTVATLPTLSDLTKSITVFVSDGAAGSPVSAFWSPADLAWLRSDTRAEVSAS